MDRRHKTKLWFIKDEIRLRRVRAPESSVTLIPMLIFPRYCFGAPYVMDAISGSSPTCEVGAFAHPAFLKEEHFEKITRPLYLSCAENDFTFNTESRDKGLKILREAKTPYGLQLFSGVEHGFPLRCDVSKSYERWCKEQSFRELSIILTCSLGFGRSR